MARPGATAHDHLRGPWRRSPGTGRPALGRATTVLRSGARRCRAAAVRPGRTVVELALMVAAVLAYELTRAGLTGSLAQGRHNAARILDLERAVGLAVEGHAQRFFVAHDLAMPLWNALYLVSQPVLFPAALLACFLLARESYARLRTVVLLAWAAGLVWYAALPVAPPRLAGLGMADTVSANTPFDLNAPLVRSFYNPVAAMPSLHVGFALAVGWALWRVSRRAWVRALAVAYPLLIAVSVVVTGNHFVLDGLAGTALVLAAAAIVRLVGGRSVAGAAGSHGPAGPDA